MKPGTRPVRGDEAGRDRRLFDGFIHAGNLAYLALMTLFPFVIVAAAVARCSARRKGGAQTS
jgi:membrane protein